jgi:hypothetical protein
MKLWESDKSNGKKEENMKNYEVKRLYKGYASIRSYIIDDCIRDKGVLQISYNGKIMTIDFSKPVELKVLQLHKRKFASKYNGNQEYELYDVKFREDSA